MGGRLLQEMDASNSIDASGPWFAGTYVNGLLNLTEVVLEPAWGKMIFPSAWQSSRLAARRSQRSPAALQCSAAPKARRQPPDRLPTGGNGRAHRPALLRGRI